MRPSLVAASLWIRHRQLVRAKANAATVLVVTCKRTLRQLFSVSGPPPLLGFFLEVGKQFGWF
jgi:hypothetical protein